MKLHIAIVYILLLQVATFILVDADDDKVRKENANTNTNNFVFKQTKAKDNRIFMGQFLTFGVNWYKDTLLGTYLHQSEMSLKNVKEEFCLIRKAQISQEVKNDGRLVG